MFLGCDNPMNFNGKSNNGNFTEFARPTAEPTVEASNNLSFPVIWSDGVTKSVPGLPGMEPTLSNEATFTDDSGTWWLQGVAENTWQAESYTPSAGPINISSIDWGDNLEAKSWPAGAVVRVETVLYDTLAFDDFTPETMLAYTMHMDPSSESGINEVWGTDGTTYNSGVATIYSGAAYLVIQRLTVTRENIPDGGIYWDDADLMWKNTSGTESYIEENPVFNAGVWDDVDGPGGYSAEVNIQGKVIYGYNWDTKVDSHGPGDYRITFALVNNHTKTSVDLNTDFGTTEIVVPEEEVEATGEIIIMAEPTTGGVAQVDAINNLSYIDVRLDQKSSGRGANGGNGGGGHNGGGNGGGGHNGNGNGRF